MKKFLVYLLAVVLVAAMGFSVFYLVRDNETLSITNTSLYKEVNDEFSVGLKTKKLKSYTTISLNYAGDEGSVQEISKNLNPSKGQVTAKLKATGGGVVRINFQTNNSKFRNLYCDIMIGDGSVENPYYISTAEQLYAIGRSEKYAANLHYELISDIDCASIAWNPEDVAFSGSLKGNGYAIKNITIDGNAVEGTNLGLFAVIDSTGSVDNVVLENFTINVKDSGVCQVGALAAVNHGVISRVNAKSVVVRSNNSEALIGGIVAVNETTDTLRAARLDRIGVNLDFAYGTYNEGTAQYEYTGIKGTIGGIASNNIDGTIINCYTVGSVRLEGTESASFAGIVNLNKSTSSKTSANVKNCYSAAQVDKTLSTSISFTVAGILNVNDSAKRDDIFTGTQIEVNTISGNYYASEMLSHEEGVTVTCAFEDDAENIRVTQLPREEMINEENQIKYVSSIEFEYKKIGDEVQRVVVLDGDGEPVKKYWDFVNTWSIASTENSGLPYLTYSNIASGDDIDNITTYKTVDTVEKLLGVYTDWANNNSAGTLYLVTANIDMAGNLWTPLGTKDNPFNATIAAEEGKEIKNLTIVSGVENAGLVGVLGNAGQVTGITLNGFQAQEANGYKYAAAIAAFNGTDNLIGGIIKDCKVINSTIYATEGAAGIVAYNNGIVQSCAVVGDEGDTVIAVKPSEKHSYVGGLSAYNINTIEMADSTNKVTGNVSIYSIEIAGVRGRYVYMGGAVGWNKGAVAYVEINTTKSSDVAATGTYGIRDLSELGSMPTVLNFYAGGLVGSNQGKARVKNSVVSTEIMLPALNTCYIGGVAGQIDADYNSYKGDTLSDYEANYSVYGCAVIDSTLGASRATNFIKVAGLVGEMTVRNTVIESTEFNSYDKYTVNKSNKLYATVVASYVSNTTLCGTRNAGLVLNLKSGVVSDCGANRVTFAAVTGGYNYGFAYQIVRNPGDKVAGMITRSYGTFTFVSGSVNYAETESMVHSTKSTTLDSKTGGWIVDYAYKVLDESGLQVEYPKVDKSSEYNGSVNITGNLTSDLFNAKGWNNPGWLVPNYEDRVSYWLLDGGKVKVDPTPIPAAVAELMA